MASTKSVEDAGKNISSYISKNTYLPETMHMFVDKVADNITKEDSATLLVEIDIKAQRSLDKYSKIFVTAKES